MGLELQPGSAGIPLPEFAGVFVLVLAIVALGNRLSGTMCLGGPVTQS
jgi:hypothetical protein